MNNKEPVFFKGDDLVDVITVNRPKGAEDLEITRAELQVGPLTFVKDNPIFPYKVSILRNKSMFLDFKNPIYLRLYYNSGSEVYRTTCLGSLNLTAYAQVVGDENTDNAET